MSVPFTAAKYLKEKIITGEMKPGQKINELELAEELAISRPPLREAFRLLENHGLVENIPRKGAYVTKLSLHNYEELTQIRMMIESFAIDLLKQKGITKLTNVVLTLNGSWNFSKQHYTKDNEILDQIQMFLDFHISLVKSTENSQLISIFNYVIDNLARYLFIYIQSDNALEHTLTKHENILRLFKDGDYGKAKQELIEHITFTMNLVNDKLQEMSKAKCL